MLTSGIGQQLLAGVDHLDEVVGRMLSGHAHRDTPEPLISRLRDAHGSSQRLFPGAVVVGAEIDGFLVDVGQQLSGRSWPSGFRCNASPPRCSPSTEPKLPWPSTSMWRSENSWAIRTMVS